MPRTFTLTLKKAASSGSVSSWLYSSQSAPGLAFAAVSCVKCPDG